MGVNLALLGLENLRLDFSDPALTMPSLAPNLVLSDVISDSGYNDLSAEGKALQRTLFLGEPEVPEPTISLKQFIESFLQATADVFEARGFNNIADQLRSIHNFDRIIGEIEMRINKYEEDSIAQVDAIERFLAIMPGISSAVDLAADIDSSHVSETGTGLDVLNSINQENSGTLKEWIEELYRDLITDSLLAFDDSQITNPSGFADGLGTLEEMKSILESRNGDVVPATGTLDRTLYDSLSSIQSNWAAVYSQIQASASQWSDYDNIGDFSGINFSQLIDGQNFDDWTGTLIDDWNADITDTTLLTSHFSSLADAIRAQYELDLLSNTHLTDFSSGALGDSEIGGYFIPIPTEDPLEKILEVGKYYYNPVNGFYYKAIADLTSDDVAVYDDFTSYEINSYVYDPDTNALYKSTANTTAGVDPTDTTQWKQVGFNDTSLWSLNANSTVQLSATVLGIEKMIDDLAEELSSDFVGAFSIDAGFSAGDLVVDEGYYYSLNAGETITQTGELGSAGSYNRGDLLTYNGTIYISLVNHAGYDAYSSSGTYTAGEIVVFDGELWEYVADASVSGPSVPPSTSATGTWEKVSDSVLGDTSKYLIYSGPLSQFWTLETEKRARINLLRAAASAALVDLNADLVTPPGNLQDIRTVIAATQNTVQGELEYYESMVDIIKNYISSVSDLTSATEMIEGVLVELQPAVSGSIGVIPTGAGELSTWISSLDSVSAESGFKPVAEDLSSLLTSLKVIYDAYNSSSTPTSEQITTALDLAESLRGDSGSMTSNYINYLGQWEGLEDDFNAIFPTGSGQFNPLGALQAQSISALADLMTHVSDLESMSSGNGDPLYADIYFSMKNTFETLLSNLNFRLDASGTQLARLVPVRGSGGMDEDAYFDAFRRILKHHSTPNDTAPLSLQYEYYLAVGNNTRADEILNTIINGGAEDLSGSSSPGLLSQLKDEFKDLADAVYMPGTDKRNICTTNGNSQTFLHTGSMEAMRTAYNNVKDTIASLMNEVDTALTRETIGDTTSDRFVNISDLATIEGGRADGVGNFKDNASDFDIAKKLDEFNDYGLGEDARMYHASIATASTSLMSILSNFEFFFNGEMESDAGIWGSQVSAEGTPYAFTQHGKMDGRMQEQAYVFDYSNVLTNAKDDLNAKYDSKATWIMKDLLKIVEQGYDKSKDYFRDNVVDRADNYWVEFNSFHMAVETEARRLVASAFATTTPMEDVFYSVFEADDMTADEKRLLSKVLNLLMTLLISMLGSNQEIRDVVQGLQRGEKTLAQVSESITITESMANNMIERAMAMAADMIDREEESLENSGNYLGADPVSSQQYLDMASFYLGNKELSEALEEANEEQDRLEV